MKTKIIILAIFSLVILFISSCEKEEPSISNYNYYYYNAPVNWTCKIITENFEDNIIPDSIDIPRATVEYTNMTVEITGDNSEKIHPSLKLYLYDNSGYTHVDSINSFIEKRSKDSGCIPLYYGETTMHYLVTSPCHINSGISTEESKDSLNEIHNALKRIMTEYNKELIDGK